MKYIIDQKHNTHNFINFFFEVFFFFYCSKVAPKGRGGNYLSVIMSELFLVWYAFIEYCRVSIKATSIFNYNGQMVTLGSSLSIWRQQLNLTAEIFLTEMERSLFAANVKEFRTILYIQDLSKTPQSTRADNPADNPCHCKINVTKQKVSRTQLHQSICRWQVYSLSAIMLQRESIVVLDWTSKMYP